MSATVRIAQLYPSILGVTGDRGNVRALQVRLERAGAAVEFLPVAVGDSTPEDIDILVIGNGPLSAMRSVHADLSERGDSIRSLVADGAALLAVGGGAELLSRRVVPLEGDPLDGLGIFAADVARTRTRKVGYIIVETPAGRVIGFEDHASEWSLSEPADAYGQVAFGRGSYAHPVSAAQPVRGELMRSGNAIAANVQGPMLPLNPALSRELLSGVLTRRDLRLDLDRDVESLDGHAAGARAAIEALVHGKGFNTIQL